MIIWHLKGNIFVLTAIIMGLAHPPLAASEEQTSNIAYGNVHKINVNDPAGEIYVKTHDDGTDHVYLQQKIVETEDSRVNIEHHYQDGELTIVATYLTTHPRTQHNVVRDVHAEPGSSAYGIVTSGSQDVQGNVVEGIRATGGGSAYGIVVGGRGATIRGNVIRNIGPGGHGIVIGGQAQEDQQGDRPYVRHTIVVPKKKVISYQLFVATGRISTKGLTGELIIHNPTGHTSIVKHTGSVSARSTTGDVDIQNYQSGARVTLQTTTGSVTSPFGQGNITNKQIGDGTYRVTANTTTGNITFTRSN